MRVSTCARHPGGSPFRLRTEPIQALRVAGATFHGTHSIRSHPACIPPAVRAEGGDEARQEGARRGWPLKAVQVGETVAGKVEQMELGR